MYQQSRIIEFLTLYEKKKSPIFKIERQHLILLQMCYNIGFSGCSKSEMAASLGYTLPKLNRILETTISKLECEFTVHTYKNDIDKTPLNHLLLSQSLIRNLNKKNIKTIGDLKAIDLQELLLVHGVGPKRVTELKNHLSLFGVKLKI